MHDPNRTVQQAELRPTRKATRRQRASMATSRHLDGIGTPDEAPAPCDCGAGNEGVHHRDISNAMEKTKPELGESPPDEARRLFPDARESPCIV